MKDYDSDLGESAGFEYEFSGDDKDEDWGRHLWFRSAEYGNVAQVAHLVQKFLKQFAPSDSWSLTWATTCSKPRAGEFGGAAVFITASDSSWLRQQRELLRRLRSAAVSKMPYVPAPGETELLEGLIELTDALADQAHDNYGVDCLLR